MTLWPITNNSGKKQTVYKHLRQRYDNHLLQEKSKDKGYGQDKSKITPEAPFIERVAFSSVQNKLWK